MAYSASTPHGQDKGGWRRGSGRGRGGDSLLVWPSGGYCGQKVASVAQRGPGLVVTVAAPFSAETFVGKISKNMFEVSVSVV